MLITLTVHFFLAAPLCLIPWCSFLLMKPNLINWIFTALNPELSRLILFLLHRSTHTRMSREGVGVRLKFASLFKLLCCCCCCLDLCVGALFIYWRNGTTDDPACWIHTDRSLRRWNGHCCCAAISHGCPQSDSLLLHPHPPTCHLLHLWTHIPRLISPSNTQPNKCCSCLLSFAHA